MSTDHLVRRGSDDNDIRINLGYKPPLYGNKRKFAAEMFKNRKIYFNRKTSNNSVNHSSVGYSDRKGTGIINTAKVRMSGNNRNYLAYDNQDTTSVNDTDSPGK